MNTKVPPASQDDNDMPAEIDFANGVRGKFFRSGSRLRMPIYLDDATQSYLADRALAKGIDMAVLVNQLLKGTSKNSFLGMQC